MKRGVTEQPGGKEAAVKDVFCPHCDKAFLSQERSTVPPQQFTFVTGQTEVSVGSVYTEFGSSLG